MTRIVLLPLLGGCLLPLTPDTTTAGLSSSGELSDGDFRLYFNPGEQWDGGGCWTLDLLYQGDQLDDWQANITLSRDAADFSFLDPVLDPSADDQLQWTPDEVTIGDDGYLGSASYCAEPAAAPAALTVWAIEGDPSEPTDDNTFSARTLEDTTGRVWVTIDDAGDQGSSDCMALEVVNLSGQALQGWRLDLVMSGTTEVTDTFNAYALASDAKITVRPTSADALAAYAAWEGWVCLSPFAEPTTATLTDGVDTTPTKR